MKLSTSVFLNLKSVKDTLSDMIFYKNYSSYLFILRIGLLRNLKIYRFSYFLALFEEINYFFYKQCLGVLNF